MSHLSLVDQEFEDHLAEGLEAEDQLEVQLAEHKLNHHRCSLARDQRERGGAVMVISGVRVVAPDFWIVYALNDIHWADCKSATEHVSWRTGKHAGEEFVFVARKQLLAYKRCSLATRWPVDIYHLEAGAWRVAYDVFQRGKWVLLGDGYLKIKRRDGSSRRTIGFCLSLDYFETPFKR